MGKANAPFVSHDHNARYDPKIRKMKAKYGLKGLGLFWTIIEIMLENQKENYIFDISNDMNINLIVIDSCGDYNIKEVKEYIDDCVVRTKLFKKKGFVIYSETLIERMTTNIEIGSKRSGAAKKRWGKENA